MVDINTLTTQEIWIFIAATIIMGVLTSIYANSKGRDSTSWFVIGSIFGIFALIALYFLPAINTQNDEEPTMLVMPPDPALQAMAPLPAIERMKEEDQLWYYLDLDHQQMGPVSIVALRDLWNRGLLDLNGYVWSQGMEQWQKVEELPGLLDALNKR